MAEAKSPKKTESNKKIVDVKTDGDGATGTSRPVIVTNRPILKDPMMAEISQLTGGLEAEAADEPKAVSTKTSDEPKTDEADAKAGGAPELTPSAKKIAVKLTGAPAEPTTEEREEKPAVAPSKKRVVIKPLSDDLAPAKAQPATKAGSAAKTEPTIADLAKPDPMEEVLSTDTAEVLADDVDATEKAVEPSVETEVTDESALDDSDSETEDSKDEQPADETDVTEEVVTGGTQPGRSFDDDATADKPDEAEQEPEEVELDKRGKPKKKLKKPGELTAEQQKAIETGEYFLPITTAETRRTRRELALAFFLTLVLVAIWIDIMLDAGLISIGNFKPPTNFF